MARSPYNRVKPTGEQSVERTIGIIKDALKRLGSQLPPTVTCQNLASLVCSAFSDTVSVHGASPFELMLGRRPEDFLKVEFEDDDELLGTLWHPEQSHAKKLEHKRKAWQAVLDSTCTASIRRAHRAKTRANTIWQQGEMVHYWRSSGRGGRGNRREFRGAARVLLQERVRSSDNTTRTSGIVWTAHGGRLLRVVPEHLRPPTQAESTIHELSNK